MKPLVATKTITTAEMVVGYLNQIVNPKTESV